MTLHASRAGCDRFKTLWWPGFVSREGIKALPGRREKDGEEWAEGHTSGDRRGMEEGNGVRSEKGWTDRGDQESGNGAEQTAYPRFVDRVTFDVLTSKVV